jgi:hypothetical protein
MKDAEVKSLKQKLVAIRSALGPVKKEHRNPHFNYDYVSEGQIMALLEPQFTEHGILYTTSVEKQDVHYTEKGGVFVAVETLHTFEDLATGETLVLKGAGLGWDSGDKGSYKAQTGAAKYNLMKNFMVSDEADPETGEQRSAAKPTGRHRPTRDYESEGEREGDKQGKQVNDLMELSTWMQKNHVPESFVLAMLVEKKMVNANVKKLGNVQPGIIRRVLNPGSLQRLLKAWQASKVPEPQRPLKKDERGPFDEPVRTNEGDQTPPSAELRVFCNANDIDAQSHLEQEGFDNWRKVKVHFGKNKGTPLGKLTGKSLMWYITEWVAKPYKGKWENATVLLDAALTLAHAEIAEAAAAENDGGRYND